MNRPATIDRRAALLRDAVAIVQIEYANDLELGDVARRISASPRQLQRAYAEIGGTTFRTHLTDVRMHRAAVLLRTTSASVHDVARRVGYRQAAQFAKAFRSRHGVAPSVFRRG